MKRQSCKIKYDRRHSITLPTYTGRFIRREKLDSAVIADAWQVDASTTSDGTRNDRHLAASPPVCFFRSVGTRALLQKVGILDAGLRWCCNASTDRAVSGKFYSSAPKV